MANYGPTWRATGQHGELRANMANYGPTWRATGHHGELRANMASYVDAVAPMLMQELRSFRDLFGGAKSAVNVTCLSCNKVTLGGGRVTGVEGRGRGSRKHRNWGSGKSSIL